jgi:UDP-N-acetylmuramoylalanine-D-glutamate ligase
MSYAIGKHPDFEAFSPDYSIFTNFRKDHLNWHGTLQDYLDAKMNLLAHTKKKSIISDQVKEFADDNSLTIHFENNCRFYGIDG